MSLALLSCLSVLIVLATIGASMDASREVRLVLRDSTGAAVRDADVPTNLADAPERRSRPHLLPMAWALAAFVALVASWWAGPAETPQPERLQGSTQADWVWVLPADVAASDIDWARIGIATLIADRLRHHGMVVVPIDNVVARLGDASPPSEPEALRREWGAARVVVPTVRREGGQWRVELECGHVAKRCQLAQHLWCGLQL